jgi:hypothetical protein
MSLKPNWSPQHVDPPGDHGKVRVARRLDDLGLRFAMNGSGQVTMTTTEWERLLDLAERE